MSFCRDGLRLPQSRPGAVSLSKGAKTVFFFMSFFQRFIHPVGYRAGIQNDCFVFFFFDINHGMFQSPYVSPWMVYQAGCWHCCHCGLWLMLCPGLMWGTQWPKGRQRGLTIFQDDVADMAIFGFPFVFAELLQTVCPSWFGALPQGFTSWHQGAEHDGEQGWPAALVTGWDGNRLDGFKSIKHCSNHRCAHRFPNQSILMVEGQVRQQLVSALGDGLVERIWKDACCLARAVQETCSSEMLGGQGADFMRGVAFWSIRCSGLLRWFCVTGASLRMTWHHFCVTGAVL